MPVILQGKQDQMTTDSKAAQVDDEMDLEEANSAHEPQREEEEITPPATSWTVPAPSPPAATAENPWTGSISTTLGVQSEPASLGGIALPTVQGSPTESLKRGPGDIGEANSPTKKARVDEETTGIAGLETEEIAMEEAVIIVPIDDGAGIGLSQAVEEDSDNDDDGGSDFEIPKLVMKSDLVNEKEKEEEE
jgi:hypothetical protein